MTVERKRKPSSGTAGAGWERWWPRIVAVMQLAAGIGILGWETTHAGDRSLLQFWGVCLVMGAPTTTVALQLAGERLLGGGGPPPGGRP